MGTKIIKMFNINSSREQVLAGVTIDGMLLKNASNQFKDDKEIVLAAVKENGWALG
ncbi:MAG: DUF4116 domain-containing protein [Gammaproteobacteria bacterium]|nr:DUF4116 domain-containing protein [Gammaproteobacteria bacterium]